MVISKTGCSDLKILPNKNKCALKQPFDPINLQYYLWPQKILVYKSVSKVLDQNNSINVVLIGWSEVCILIWWASDMLGGVEWKVIVKESCSCFILKSCRLLCNNRKLLSPTGALYPQILVLLNISTLVELDLAPFCSLQYTSFKSKPPGI